MGSVSEFSGPAPPNSEMDFMRMDRQITVTSQEYLSTLGQFAAEAASPRRSGAPAGGSLTKPRGLERFWQRCCRALAPGLLTAALCGCTSISEYVHNGFKVGPNYQTPPAPVAQHWIDASDVRVRSKTDDLSVWWNVFNDPALNLLVCNAYHQNLSLRQAGFRVLEARDQLGIDIGEIFPQTQTMTGSYQRNAISKNIFSSQNVPRHFYSQWNYGFNLAWELDFWGRFRRAVESDNALLDASVENYDDVLVTLLGDIATDYAQMRTFEARIKYAQNNVELQRETLTIVEARFRAGTTSELDVDQARSTLASTEAAIPELEISLRQSINQLCILLGMPPEDFRAKIGPAPIPVAPPDVAVGIPADLLRRRPDVRRAERQAASQSALIGVAESDFYPHISILGTLNYSAQEFPNLFRSGSLDGNVGPSFTWNVLNYGRIINNVHLQDAKFQEMVAIYQNSVLSAAQDAENGIVTFLRAQERTRFQTEAVTEAEKAVKIALTQYKGGTIDFTRVTQVEQTLVEQQDILAQAQGEIAAGLIQTYKALGGGWQIRLTDCQAPPLGAQGPLLPAAESIPAPNPTLAPALQPPSK
jgi:NodT family efflux transporter outer membrane factor (OMF) lipoprotein